MKWGKVSIHLSPTSLELLNKGSCDCRVTTYWNSVREERVLVQRQFPPGAGTLTEGSTEIGRVRSLTNKTREEKVRHSRSRTRLQRVVYDSH